MFTFKHWKNVLQFVMWNDFPSFLTCIFYIFPSSLLANSHILRSVRWPPIKPCARDIWWTLDFASAFLSPGVNSRPELVPSPRAYARNGAPRRWLGKKVNMDKSVSFILDINECWNSCACGESQECVNLQGSCECRTPDRSNQVVYNRLIGGVYKAWVVTVSN
jgi:hypothetical protein